MENSLFNSLHEFSYRMLLLLNIDEIGKVSVDRLAALDFIAIYGHDFDIAYENLHGSNRFKFSEFANRRRIINESVKQLVLSGFILFHSLKKGFLYSIAPAGKNVCASLNDVYVEKYIQNATLAIAYAKTMSDRELTKTINDYSIIAAREG